jgi:hypothetical protein
MVIAAADFPTVDATICLNHLDREFEFFMECHFHSHLKKCAADSASVLSQRLLANLHGQSQWHTLAW